MNYLLTMAHGADCFRDEAVYAVLSFWRQHQHNMAQCTVLVATDRPDAFTRIVGTPAWLRFVPLTAQQLQEWRGAGGAGSLGDYVHRIKPLAIQHAARSVGATVADAFLFVDSDTSTLASLLPVFDRIREQGAVFLHQREGTLRGNRTHSRSQRRLWRASQQHRFHVGGRLQMLAPELKLWNSGLIGFRGDQLGLFDDTLALIDELRATLHIATAEQVALSAVLAERGFDVQPTDHAVLHYHQFKEFRADLAAFFARYAGSSPVQWRDRIHEVDPALRTQPKLAFNRLPKWWRQLRKALGRGWKPLPLPWHT